MGLPPASPYAVAGGRPGTTGFSEKISSYTANHVQSMDHIRPDSNGVGAGPRPSLPGLQVSYVQEHLPLADGFLRHETLSVRPIGPCCWRAAEPAAPTVGAGNSGDTPLGRAAVVRPLRVRNGSAGFLRPSSSLFPLHSSLIPQYAPLCCSTTPNVLHNSMISSQTPQLRTYQESIWTRSS